VSVAPAQQQLPVGGPVTRPFTIAAIAFVTLIGIISGCSIRTAGAPKGDLTLTATFDDAQNLVTGHSVQLADVKVGTVMSVKLMGYRARVTMSIKNGVQIPQGTSAEIATTSLLGENFVRLTVPKGADLSKGPFLADGAQITKTSMQPQFEQVVEKAGPIINALAGNDVATIVDAGATALGGKGEQLNSMVAKSGKLVAIFAQQRRELGEAVDQLAKLGRSLETGKDELGQAPEKLEQTTRMLVKNKDKVLRTIRELTRMARLLNDKVFEGRVLRLKRMLQQLDPVLQTFGDSRAELTRLLTTLVTFEQKVPRAIYDGTLLLYPVLRLVLPGGTTVPGSATPQVPSAAGQTGSPTRSQPGAGSGDVPEGLRDALPNIDDFLGSSR
jgi:phospholipid/cholesterol/gamma-HCH transport system substrate-binding protein